MKFGMIRKIRDQWQTQCDQAQLAHEKALDDYEKENGTRPADVKPASGFVYVLALIMLFVTEVPLNYAAFSYLAMPVPYNSCL